MSADFKELVEATVRSVEPASMLDVGARYCGLLQGFPEIPARVGLEVHRPYLRYALDKDEGKALKGIVPLNADARCLEDLFLPGSFDVVTCIDVIEHFHKEDAIWILEALEKIARKLVVIYTPDGFIKAPPLDDEVSFGATYYQTHRCGFTLGEMQERGYSVVSIPGTWTSIFCAKKKG